MTARQSLRILITAAALLLPRAGLAYSVQTHEQLVDLAWKPGIVPLLLSRFPGLTQAQLNEAHAYAYGGCAIQDIGYYPFGSAFFSDLTHYVRSGDFIRSLLRNAKTPDELAFAVGALTHYVGDTTGHSLATNPGVAAEFPKLKARYGPSVPYDVAPHAHVRAEFGFDIDQISKNRFAPSAYLEHVGLKVAGDLLVRSFYEIYGIQLNYVMGGKRRSSVFSAYRFAVRRFLPRIAYAENVLHGHKMPADTPGADLDALEHSLRQSEFENGWNQYRRRPGIGTYTLAGLIYILPKFGPLAMLAIKIPTPAVEDAYVKSVNLTTLRITQVLADVKDGDQLKIIADIPNRDLDTGFVVRPGGYRLTDETYAKLLGEVTKTATSKIPSGLKSDIEHYYADPNAPIATKNKPAKWATVQTELATLGQMPTIPEP